MLMNIVALALACVGLVAAVFALYYFLLALGNTIYVFLSNAREISTLTGFTRVIWNSSIYAALCLFAAVLLCGPMLGRLGWTTMFHYL